jgi:hypothetical protein
MTGFPPWLRDTLIERGVLTPSGLTRKWKIRTCRRCHSWILTGLDSHVAALEAQADPIQLNPQGEAQALLDDRATYDADGPALSRRLHWHITRHPAGPRTRVLAQHRCGSPPPPDWQQPPAPTRGPEPKEPSY